MSSNPSHTVTNPLDLTTPPLLSIRLLGSNSPVRPPLSTLLNKGLSLFSNILWFYTLLNNVTSWVPDEDTDPPHTLPTPQPLDFVSPSLLWSLSLRRTISGTITFLISHVLFLSMPVHTENLSCKTVKASLSWPRTVLTTVVQVDAP